MRKLQVWMLALLLLLPVSLAAEDVIIDLDNLYISRPKIVLDFTAPATLETFDLRSANGARIYPLCEKPMAASDIFETSYELLTTTATDAACTNGEPQYLAPGDYLLMIQASDINAKLTRLYRVPFNTSGLEITMLSPLSNVSAVRPPTMLFETTRLSPTIIGQEGYREPIDALCRYSTTLQASQWDRAKFTDLTSAVSADPSSTHSLQIDHSGMVYIICKESAAAGQEAKFAVDIKYDLTPPRISGIVKTPEKVTTLAGTKGLMTVKLTTDDLSVCNITGDHNTRMFMEEDIAAYGTYVTSHDVILEFPLAAVGTSPKNFTYAVQCTNLAGRQNTTRFNASVDFSAALSLEILEPAGIINRTAFDIVARPALVADPSHQISGCYLDDSGSKLAANAMTRDSYPDGAGGTITVYRKTVSYNPDGTQDGNKTYTITCYDQKSTTRKHNITIDSRAPSAPVINASQFICDGNITARFKSTDQGTGVISYTYTVSDVAAVIATGTTGKNAMSIEIIRPVQGDITWTVSAIDGAQNNGSANTTAVTVREGADEECGRPPFITLKAPNMGMAKSVPYDFTVGTVRPAECSFSFSQTQHWQDMTPMDSDDGRTHTVERFNTRFSQTTPKTVYVGCNESGRLHLKSFRIGVDMSAPKIFPTAIPNPVMDRERRVVTLTVRTDDPTYCTIDGDEDTLDDRSFGAGSDAEQSSYTTEHRTTLDYRHINDPSKQEFPYEITCKNLALMESTAEHKTIVHLGADFAIEVLSPPEFTNKDDITLIIRPSREAVCTWDNNGTADIFTVVNGTHTARLGVVEEKSYNIPVFCTSSDLEASAVIAFTIDKSVPGVEGLSGPEILCQGTEGQFAFNVTNTLDSDPLITYMVTSNMTNDTFTTDDDIIVLDGATLETGKYTLTVSVTNRANTSSAPVSTQFEVARKRSEMCTLPPNHCANGEQDTGETSVDCGGTCPACDACADDAACGAGEWCDENVCVPTVLECDSDPVCGTGQICEAGKCVTRSSFCVNDDECAGTEECVSGTCMPKAGCETDYDCFPGICKEGACAEAPAEDCASNDDCTDGDICMYGSCTSPGDPGPSPGDPGDLPEEEGSNLLSILLIAFGLAVMGGAGYVLYQQQAEKQAEAARPSMAPARPAQPGQLSQPMAAQYAQDPAARQAALEQEYARRQAERAKRESTFQNFGGERPASPSQPAASAQPSRSEEKAQADADDGYIDLGAVKRKQEQRRQDDKPGQKPEQKPEQKRKEDAFDELDKL